MKPGDVGTVFAGARVDEAVPLAPLTTLRVGPVASRVITCTSTEQVVATLRHLDGQGVAPLLVLAGGSNVVIADTLTDLTVVRLANNDIRIEGNTVRAEAGAVWDDVVVAAIAAGLGGLECLSGIPGSAGATPVQNVGAYGQEVSQTIVSVEVFDLATKQVREMTAEDCEFDYRRSVFNTRERGRYIILRVAYGLSHGGRPSLQYADLRNYFVGRNEAPTLSEIREAVLKIRASKGMLITPGDPDSLSAGSFFKNPVLTAAQFDELLRRAQDRNLQVPSYPALSQQKKISAAWLVENSGFAKGYVKGRAGISSKHALALVNLGGGSAGEILALKAEIQKQVDATWGIQLEPEPVFVGF